MSEQLIFNGDENMGYNDAQYTGITILIIGVVLVAFLALLTCISIVPAGHVGIQDTYGSVSDMELQPGISIKSPFTAVYPITVKTVELKETAKTPTNEGLMVGLDMSLLYKVDPLKAVQIYNTIGPSYQDVVIVPTLRSATREVTSKYEAKALYGGNQRDLLAQEIQNKIVDVLADRGIIVESILLREIDIPEEVKNAIEAKLKAEQEAEQMQFVIQKETLEADRKAIEAEGIKKAQGIIAESLTPEYLQWYWLQKLNDNPNVVYVATESGLPLFRNVDAGTTVKKVDVNQ